MLQVGFAAPAAAIPSPEIVVGALTGLSQLGALVLALLGGGAALAIRRRGTDGAAVRAMLMRQRRWTLGFAVVAAAFAVSTTYLWSTAASERQARLEATLSRPTRLPGQPRLDPTLKELSFAEQSRHALGISTADAEALIAASDGGRTPVEILDIRERAEVEMGTFQNARGIRYPDLAAIRSELKGRSVLLVCHNGNRSSETCQSLAAEGIDCRFIVGGLEKWIVEGRTAGGFARRSLDEVRALPDYPNARRLLDTEATHLAIEKDGAVFVDVRYPGEFAAGHLPGAINLPMRRMTSPELATAIAGLPNAPVIVPCYERRSCFFGEVLGLELTRIGRPFLGRYTVPWEYVVVAPPPPHIAAALAEARRGWWDRAADGLAAMLATMAAEIGLAAAIILLAALSRLLVLPFSLKAERDQLAASHMAPEVARLKLALKDDPLRLTRALQSLYRRHGLTPLSNQLALLLLPVLALSVAASGRAGERASQGLLWLADAAKPDPHLVLPLLFASLFTLYIHWTIARTPRQRLVAWLICLPAFTVLGMTLPAAAALYLVVSALLLILQRTLVTGLPQQAGRWLFDRLRIVRSRPAGMLSLLEAGTQQGLGNKAIRLGELTAAGLPVPPGVVLDGAFLERWRLSEPLARQRLVRAIARSVGGERFAVRSSAAAEDGATQSFAGVYESVLDVTRDGLSGAIDRVLASFAATRATAYAGDSAANGNIIVQRMVAAQYAGVIFTRAPDATGQMLVELVAGTGEALVSGLATPKSFYLGRVSAQLSGGAQPPIDLKLLVRLAQRAEARFGRPQDIEWTWKDGQFFIVQSRDITMPVGDSSAAVDRHWCDVLGVLARSGPAAGLTRNELAEQLPRPTQLSLSLIEKLHASGGSVDLACRALGLAYGVEEDAPPAFVPLLGRLYVNAGESTRRAPRLSRLAVRRALREADACETAFHGQFVPRFVDEVGLLRAMDLDALETDALMRHARRIVEHFVTETHVEAEVVNILAELSAMHLRLVAGVTALDAPAHDTGATATMVARTVAEARMLAPDAADAYLLRHLGHRALLDYELAQPRLREDASALATLLAPYAIAGASPRQPVSGSRSVTGRHQAAVDRTRRLQVLKEDAKHIVLMELAEIRRLLLAIDRRFGLGGCIFHLGLDEALMLDAACRDDLLARAEAKAAEAQQLAALPALPAKLTLVEIEAASRPGARGVVGLRGPLSGTRVAGHRLVEGRALIVAAHLAEAGLPIPEFQDGDIIVTPLLHPAWLPYMLRSGGVVCETGGWLSHMAIVARERDVAMIVGVDAALYFGPGARIRLHPDGCIEVLQMDKTAELSQLAAE